MKDGQRIAILGGGPIGLACALLLAQRRIASVVVDARTLEEARRDARLLALSRGTWQVLRPLLAGRLPRHASIRDVYVTSAGEFGATHLSADDFDGADLGVTALYGDLLEALAGAVAAQPLIEVRRPLRASRIDQTPSQVRIACDDATTLEAPLAVRAEGVPIAERAAAQWALVADVRVRGSAPGSAYERFTREGPLALLPTPLDAGSGATRTLALVWCMSASAAERRLAVAADACLRELQQAVGPRIGTVESIGPRRRYPLLQAMKDDVREHRVVVLGNAAQTLHPVAGQGFNLGLRDCVTLADALANQDDIDAALAAYAQRRRADRAAIASLTSWLPRIFASRFGPVGAARSAGLVAFDLVAPLRRNLAQLLMFGVRT